MYFRGAHAAIIVYAVNDRNSFDEIGVWLDTFRDSTQDATIFIVGNKIDLETERMVSEREGREKALKVNAFFTEVSAITGAGIEELFHLIPEGCDVGPASCALLAPQIKEPELKKEDTIKRKRRLIC
jgi:GTPase SAR1 family protein